MNNFKNSVIFILSLIILVQSALLIYFISRKSPVEKPAQAARQQAVVRKAALLKETPEPVSRKPAVAVTPSLSKGKIAIVLDDWGYTLKNADFISENDFHVTIAVLPFKAYSARIAEIAHEKGKDTIVHMPMEPLNKDHYDLEENTVMINMDKPEIMRLLRNAFDSVPYARGMNNHMGSAATENIRLMRIVMQYLKERDFFFLDSLVTSKSVCRGLARRLGVKFAQRDIFIDNESDSVYIHGQLMKLASKAKSNGSAIGIGHDRPATIAVLKEMIPKLEADGFEFVYVSELESSGE